MKLTAFLLLCVCAMPLSARAEQGSSGTETMIVALEKAWNQAYKLGDAKSLDSLLDDSVVLINDDGSVQTKAEFLGSLKAASNSQDQQVSPESMTVHMHGNTVAVATGVFHAKGVERGKHYVRRERFVDTWVYKNGKWVCVATNATPVLH
jgi:ketosteroid isomerase-like protein